MCVCVFFFPISCRKSSVSALINSLLLQGWVSTAGSPAATTAPQLYEAVLTGSGSSFYRGGTLIASNANGITGPNGLNFAYAGSSEFSDCWVSGGRKKKVILRVKM